MTDPSSEVPGMLLGRLRGALACRESFPTLTGSAYMHAHAAFESASSQQPQILASLIEDLRTPDVERLSIASIGAGSGVLDISMLSELARVRPIDFLMVEPIAEQCAAFQQRVTDTLGKDNPQVQIRQTTIEELQESRQFDHVLAIHSVYYFPDLPLALRKLLELTAPGGQLTIAVAPREAMNGLAELFWHPQHSGTVWFEEDVLTELDAIGVEATSERIDAQLRFDPRGPAAHDILSFLVQCPLDALAPDEREMVLTFLSETGEWHDEQLAVPHPVSMIRVRR